MGKYCINRILPIYHHFGRFGTDKKILFQEFSQFENMWIRIERLYHCPIIQNNFDMPYFRLLGYKDASDIHGKINFISRLNLAFRIVQTHDNFFY
jgi:hypothetical protein